MSSVPGRLRVMMSWAQLCFPKGWAGRLEGTLPGAGEGRRQMLGSAEAHTRAHLPRVLPALLWAVASAPDPPCGAAGWGWSGGWAGARCASTGSPARMRHLGLVLHQMGGPEPPQALTFYYSDDMTFHPCIQKSKMGTSSMGSRELKQGLSLDEREAGVAPIGAQEYCPPHEVTFSQGTQWTSSAWDLTSSEVGQEGHPLS